MQIAKLYTIETKNRWQYNDAKIKEYDVVDETTRSYILDKKYENKVNKKTLLASPDFGGLQQRYFMSEKQAEDYLWFARNRRRILDKVQRCTNIELYKELDSRL